MVSLGFGVGLVPKVVVDNSPLAQQVRLFCIQPEIKPYEVGVCVLEKRLKTLGARILEQALKLQDLYDAARPSS